MKTRAEIDNANCYEKHRNPYGRLDKTDRPWFDAKDCQDRIRPGKKDFKKKIKSQPKFNSNTYEWINMPSQKAGCIPVKGGRDKDAPAVHYNPNNCKGLKRTGTD